MVNSKLLMNQWRNEPSSRDQLGHHLAFTKSAQEPECGHENVMLSGRTIYILGQLQLGLNPIRTLVANCRPLLGTHDFMRLTSVEEWGFCEFATSVKSA